MDKKVKQNSMENKDHPRSTRMTSSTKYILNHKGSK
jgi:hypothetical protein